MRTFTLCALLALAAVFHWNDTAAQEDATPASALQSGAATADDADLESLRAELVRLTEQAAREMDLEELQSEVAQARRRVSASEADQKLEDICGQLKQLIEQYPDSDAAGVASMMLNVSDGTLQVVPFDFGDGRGLNFY